MNTPSQLERASAGERTTSRRALVICLSLLFCVAFAVGGCVAPYPVAPVYAAAPPPRVYAGGGYVGGGSVSIEIGDRPYYTRGPGYYVGRTYYVWRPGHFNRRHVWVHGHYVLRG